MNSVELTPSLYALKPRFQALLRPMVGALATPWLFLLIPVWFLLRMALNAADGMLAREFGQKSALGAYLDELCDVVADAALYLPFTHCIPWGVPGVAAVVFLATLSEFAGALGTMVGGERRYDGPMGKSDRALVFAALGIWVGFGGATPDWLGLLWVALALLIALNIVNRIGAGLASAKP